MSKTKKFLCVILLLLTVAVFTFGFSNSLLRNTNVTANAATENASNEEVIQPRGLAANLTISIDGGNGEVWAKAKNNFTLFPSTIYVYVELYSSQTYQESYANMKLVKMDSVTDLNMGKSIIVSVPTNGEQKYWQARMRYKFDNREWTSKTTQTILFDGQGNVIK